MSEKIASILGIFEDHNATYFKNSMHLPYATVEEENVKRTFPLMGSEEAEDFIRRIHFEEYGKVPKATDIKEALLTLRAITPHEGGIKDAEFRTAGNATVIEYDYGSQDRKVAQITADGWENKAPDIPFIRVQSMQEQVQPVRTSDEERSEVLSEFQALLGLTDDQFVIVMTYLLSCYCPFGPYPVLVIQGQEGSSKSTLSNFIRLLVDPNLALASSLPTKEKDIMIAMMHNQILVFDNLSGLNDKISDWLCRASTGTGLTVRKLRTDSTPIVFTGSCPILLNGIDNIAQRSDLISRSLIINLTALTDGQRLTKSEVTQKFNALRPKLLGILFDALSAIIRDLPTTSITSNHRMIDVIKWATPAEKLLGFEGGAIQDVCERNYLDTITTSLNDDLVCSILLDHINSLERPQWSGTMTKLLTTLTSRAPDKVKSHKDWPKRAQALSTYLNRRTKGLRDYGLEIELGREGGSGNRKYTITNHNFTTPEVVETEEVAAA